MLDFALPRTEKQIDAAKRAQRARLGPNIALGKRKRCRKGKSCGASCIAYYKFCMVDLPWVGAGLNKLRNQIQNRPKPKKSEAPAFKSGDKNVPSNRIDQVKQVLQSLQESGNVTNTDNVVQANKVNWKAGIGQGANFEGAGVFGAFISVPPENLASGLRERFPNGVGVKYGNIRPQEVEIIKKLGDVDAGPKLIAARVNAQSGKGAVAMAKVEGGTLSGAMLNGRISRADAANAYVRALAKVHKAGVAHGDAHFGNVILQPNGSAKVVDLGLANASWRLALSEALSITSGGRFGVTDGPVMGKVWENNQKVMKKLEKRGIDGEYSLDRFLQATERKNPGLAEMIAKSLIRDLYKGI